MIKEKHDKGSENVKEEPCSSDKEVASADIRVKKEDDAGAAGANCSIKKEPIRPVTKNGGIGSTNVGSLQQTSTERKTETEDPMSSTADDAAGSLPQLKIEVSLESELPNDTFSLALTNTSTHCTPPDGQQPQMASASLTKQSNMEVQYMQQQSQIFVFSTMLANAGADEVLQGRYPSIIAYHCAQPGTKKFLEKNPLKVTQFNRQNPAQWLNNLSLMKNKSCTRSPGLGPKNQSTLDNLLGPDTIDDMVGLGDGDIPWDQKNNHLEVLEGVSNGLPEVPDMDACSPCLSNVQPSLQGVKVPDENLTPQQRQHREEQLATLRKMKQLLFPENQSMAGQGQNVEGSAPVNNSNASEIDIPGHGLMAGNQSSGNVPQIPQGNQSLSAQIEWEKLQMSCNAAPNPVASSGSSLGTSNSTVSGACTIGPNVSASSTVPPRGGSTSGGPRLQGPPPPYHQTQRSASVPIALQSPSPASPNNPTSNLSLPSPRASSALNSPADSSRPFALTGRHMSTTGQSPPLQDSPSAVQPRLNHSSPGTPVSSAHLSLSPGGCNNSGNNVEQTVSTHQSPVDGVFGRTLQSIAQQKHISTVVSSSTTTNTQTTSIGVKEPNLMPVPSPQQIQYLNTFEGQELIIQKQPNTSLKKGTMISPPILPTSMDSGFPPNNPDLPLARISGPNTPTSMDVGPRFPTTPGLSTEGCRFQIPSPHTPTNAPSGDKCSRLAGGSGPGSVTGLSPQTLPGPTSDPMKNDLFPNTSPHMMDRFPGPNASPGGKMGGSYLNVSPQGKTSMGDMPNYACARSENVPLNPNCTNSLVGNAKVSHFDPITSLAQMSQQLTNSVASSLNGQGGQAGGMMGFGASSMHMMDMGGGSCHGGGPMPDMGQGGGPGDMMGIPMQGLGPPHGFHPGSPTLGPPSMRSLSPKPFPNHHHMPIPRMMGRPPPGPPPPNPFNGANVQVKPNAPNTIQYLPAKSQLQHGGGNPVGPPSGPGSGPPNRGPPSLDFLQRFAGPMQDNKLPPNAAAVQNLQYFSNCGGGGGGGVPPSMAPPPGASNHMCHMDGGGGGGGMPGEMGGHMMGGPGPMMGGPPMMSMGPMRGGGQMRPGLMRGGPGMGPGPQQSQQQHQQHHHHHHHHHHQQMVGGFGGGPEVMFGGPGMGGPGPGPGGTGAQMFVGGPKSSPMGPPPPDATQPLPPSMGQSGAGGGPGAGGFKASPFMAGPTTADPNYAQQYHNFQQQLYATGTRSQMGGQTMGPGPPPPPPQHAQQPPYFNTK